MSADPAPGDAGTDGRADRRRLLLFGVVVGVLQVGLMVAAFDTGPHTGGDNAAYVSLAHGLLERGVYADAWDPAAAPHAKYPPVFPALLAAWIALGARTWVALKTVPALFTTLGVLLAYLWAAGRRGPLFGAVVALLVALSSAVVDASHWILSDPVFVAFTFLALWALDRAAPRGADAATGEEAAPGGGSRAGRPALIAFGGAAAVLAYFTRSAGLPLVLAVAGWLALRATGRGGRRPEGSWRAFGLFVAGAGTPALLWWLRGRRVGGEGYVGEFWMVDPYDPSAGTAGVADLAGRVLENAVGYATVHVPSGIVGFRGGWVELLGVALVGLAAAGWARRARRRPGPAELFLPLYAGLVLLWPAVWSGDRFALPLLPLLFLYAGEAVAALGGGARRWLGGAATAAALSLAVLAVGVPAFLGWVRETTEIHACRALVRASGPYACWGSGVEEFVRIALWSRDVLPPGSAVLSRKPSIFYVMSGVPGRNFPFSDEPEAFFDAASEAGARWVVLDRFDIQAYRYLVPVVAARPEAFCVVGGFDTGESIGTQLLGILPEEARAGTEEGAEASEPALWWCPPGMLARVPGPIPPYDSPLVPLLASGTSDP